MTSKKGSLLFRLGICGEPFKIMSSQSRQDGNATTQLTVNSVIIFNDREGFHSAVTEITVITISMGIRIHSSRQADFPQDG